MSYIAMISRNWRDLIRPEGHPDRDRRRSPSSTASSPASRSSAASASRSATRCAACSSRRSRARPSRPSASTARSTSSPRSRDVVEDVTDIILNLKEVVFKADDAEDVHACASRRRAPARSTRATSSSSTASRSSTRTTSIATLDKKGPLSMELTVNVGRGYVPAERNKTPTMPIGTIPIDALFSPDPQGELHRARTRASGR